jgi:undecaprenyl-diphosphatase
MAHPANRSSWAPLSRTQQLAVHLVAGLFASLVLALLFALVGQKIDEEDRLTRFDVSFGTALAAHRLTHPGLRGYFLGVTVLGSFEFMLAFVPLVTFALWRRGLRRAALVWLIATAGSGILNQVFKYNFDRDRPTFKDVRVYEDNKSFPSGHSTGALVNFGLLTYLLCRNTHRRGIRAALVLGTAVLVLLVGFSRVYLGAHFLSDVLGGYLAGAAWLATCITGLENYRKRRELAAVQENG